MNYLVLPLCSITPSPTNAARASRYKADSMAELAANIKATGVRQPILVRPLPASRLFDTFDAATAAGGPRPEYELIAGQRRWQASTMADLRTIPAMVATDMANDADALRFQLVENLQREDMDPLDEAEGYQRLIEATGAAKEDIGAQINKSRRYVYNRLSLLKLCTEARTQLAQGAITLSHAELIALVPDEGLQNKATLYASGYTDEFGGVGDDSRPSVRDFNYWLRKNCMLNLQHATFKITDTTLHASAGSCKQCPKRTGYAPDIFAHVSDADVCTDPACYHAKADAHHTRLVDEAHAMGYEIIDGKAAAAIFKNEMSYSGGGLVGYSKVDQIRNDIDGQPLRKLLGRAKLKELGAVMIEHPKTKELVEAVRTTAAEAALVELGLIKPAQTEQARAKQSSADKAKVLDKEAQIAQQKLITNTSIVKKLKAQTFTLENLPIKFLQSIVADLLQGFYGKIDDLLPTLFDFEKQEDLVQGTVAELVDRIMKCKALELCLTQHRYYKESEVDKAAREAIEAMAGIDRTDLERQAAAQLKAQAKTEKVTVQRKAKVVADVVAAQETQPNAGQKQPAPVAPLAQPDLAPSQARPVNRLAPLRKAKLSAQDAQLGIAEAMQGMEGAAALAAAQDTPSDPLGQEAQAVPQVDRGEVFTVGQAVTVKPVDALRIIKHKWAGRNGTVKALEDGEVDVTFSGAGGGIGVFLPSELCAAV
jgi:ParB/RepB/Spo0J family partition protein